MAEPILGSQEREEAKMMGTVPDRSKRAEVAYFLRWALRDFEVKIHDPNEKIGIANRFISYLEALTAVNNLPPPVRDAVIAYYGSDLTQAQAAERLKVPFGTFRRRLREGLDTMVEIIWR